MDAPVKYREASMCLDLVNNMCPGENGYFISLDSSFCYGMYLVVIIYRF